MPNPTTLRATLTPPQLTSVIVKRLPTGQTFYLASQGRWAITRHEALSCPPEWVDLILRALRVLHRGVTFSSEVK